jgi:hypothetical protein
MTVALGATDELNHSLVFQHVRPVLEIIICGTKTGFPYHTTGCAADILGRVDEKFIDSLEYKHYELIL